jgi:serine/threonine-protein kinase
MLAGEPPFTGPSAQAVIAKRLVAPPPRVSVVRAAVPVALESVLLTALATSPADRYASVAAMRAALDAAALDPAAPTPRVRGPVRRRVVAAASLAALATVAAIATTRRGDDSPVSAPISTTRLAVLPFSVHGGGEFSASLAHGMVDLLSRDLDGLQRIRTVDPSAVLTRAGRFRTHEVADEARGRDIARQLGAWLYVLGGVNVVGARLRIQAALFEAGGAGTADGGAGTSRPEAVARASVEGDTAQLFALVDRLAADLVAHRYRGPGGRLVETAAATTRSLPALRAYLDAEEHLRNSRFDSAAIGYRRAVTEDSTFALAHYRLSIALGLGNQWAPAAVAAERALSLAGRLGERERRLVEAYGAFVRGAADDAERAYRAVLRDYPDDLEAQFLLGRTLVSFNPARGRSIAEARPVFDAVLAADPEFLCPI